MPVEEKKKKGKKKEEESINPVVNNWAWVELG